MNKKDQVPNSKPTKNPRDHPGFFVAPRSEADGTRIMG